VSGAMQQACLMQWAKENDDSETETVRAKLCGALAGYPRFA
jgi:hypothetical protein